MYLKNYRKDGQQPYLVALTPDMVSALAQLLPEEGSYAYDAAGTVNQELFDSISAMLEHALAADLPEQFFLTKYEEHHCYGGPEEGGWYYTERTPLWTSSHADLFLLFEDLEQQLMEDDACPDVFAALNEPSRQEVLDHFYKRITAPSDYPGNKVHRSYALATVEFDAHTTTDCFVYCLEYQPGIWATTPEERMYS